MSTMEEEITRAIGVHGAWKVRLKTSIASGRGDADPAIVALDNRCDFGKWLYGLKAEERSSEFWKKVQALHADFHKETSRVLESVVKGNKAEAERSMSPGGAFSKISSELVTLMTEWKNSVRRA